MGIGDILTLVVPPLPQCFFVFALLLPLASCDTLGTAYYVTVGVDSGRGVAQYTK